MLYTLNGLEGFSFKARDGEIGSVEDFYFDDVDWAIRYVAVDTGTWLSGRKVLLSPSSLGKVDWDGKHIQVKLTKEQVESSPSIDTHQPISRQHEIELHDHYGYPYYWGGPFMWGPVAYPGALAPTPDAVETKTQREEINALRQKQRSEDQNLRSAREVGSYYIEATDGEIGHVEDFLVEDRNWAIRYMIVDTKNWWPGKKVLVSPQWIDRVSWSDSKAYIDLPRERIKQAPEYEKNMTISRDYEERVYRHYSRSGYW